MQLKADYPRVSIIMPVYNEACYIRRSLGSVLNQDYPSEQMEVLVVDGMSEDGTRETVHELQDLYPSKNICLLDNENQIVPTAFNIGLERAVGDIIIRIDGHCEISSEYVRCCVELLSETKADCVGGPLFTSGETETAEAIALAQSSFFGVGGVAFRTGRDKPVYVDTLAFGAYRREVFDQIGNFDEELVRNQDDEFNYRLVQSGSKILMDPSLRSIYYSRASLKGLWRQYFQYGYYKVRVFQKRGAIPSWRHLVPGTFVFALLASVFLEIVTGRPWWALTVAAPYVFANLGASLWTARRELKHLPVLPLAFATLHLAYGFGFLWGLWRWRDDWYKRNDNLREDGL